MQLLITSQFFYQITHDVVICRVHILTGGVDGADYGMTFDEDDFELIQAVFGLKKVDLVLLSLIPNYKNFFSQDLESLRETLIASRLAQFNFDDCYNFVFIIAEQILQYHGKKMAI